jgi:hypothetical protein
VLVKNTYYICNLQVALFVGTLDNFQGGLRAGSASAGMKLLDGKGLYQHPAKYQ